MLHDELCVQSYSNDTDYFFLPRGVQSANRPDFARVASDSSTKVCDPKYELSVDHVIAADPTDLVFWKE